MSRQGGRQGQEGLQDTAVRTRRRRSAAADGAAAQRPKEQAAKAFKPIIVLDPGHGGHDSGAEKNGAVEKDVVLAFGKVLRDKLKKTGRYKVLMTRDDDKFIELSERVDFAERNKANCSSPSTADYAERPRRAAPPSTRCETAPPRASRVGQRRRFTESALERRAGERSRRRRRQRPQRRQSILADLAQREVDTTKERTSVFTRAVIET